MAYRIATQTFSHFLWPTCYFSFVDFVSGNKAKKCSNGSMVVKHGPNHKINQQTDMRVHREFTPRIIYSNLIDECNVTWSDDVIDVVLPDPGQVGLGGLLAGDPVEEAEGGGGRAGFTLNLTLLQQPEKIWAGLDNWTRDKLYRVSHLLLVSFRKQF